MSVSNLNVRSSSQEILDRCKADLKIIVDCCVDEGVEYDELIEAINDLVVVAALAKHKSQVKASEELGINRGTYRKFLQKALNRKAAPPVIQNVICEDDGA